MNLNHQNSDFITLTKDNLDEEHICCAISSKECKEGYNLKKEWLRAELEAGYVFRKLNARAKVFIEYGPAEKAWAPIDAPDFLMINCFWVSGQYKGKGYGKALLASALSDAKAQHKSGLVTVTGTKKLPFMSDPKWLLSQGFQVVQTLPNGFKLLAKLIQPETQLPQFKSSVLSGESPNKSGLVAYYSNRCPFAPFYVEKELPQIAVQRSIPLQLIKLESFVEAQQAPTPATVFSLFYNGKFITTDISICLPKRFDKLIPSLAID
ncbi:N-acetyltransferase [Bacteroides propionicifaciens]|uniref:N-acetyltransferase n=1 Tax=Bacteroides propionicifaciens TaxID=392838 RepID=UPI000376F52A|nr:N-acetyltransferase [Bacteroides propionicifaciens]